MVVLLFKVAFQFSLASLICLIKLTENSNENTRRIALLSFKWKRQCRLIGIILPNPLRGDDVTARQRSCWEVMFLVMSVILFGEGSPQRAQPPSPDMFKILQLGPHCTRTHPQPTYVQTCLLWNVDCRRAGSWHWLKCLLVLNTRKNYVWRWRMSVRRYHTLHSWNLTRRFLAIGDHRQSSLDTWYILHISFFPYNFLRKTVCRLKAVCELHQTGLAVRNYSFSLICSGGEILNNFVCSCEVGLICSCTIPKDASLHRYLLR